MKKIALCVFDMDGLLIDSEKGMWQKNQLRTFRELGYPEDLDFIKSGMGLSMNLFGPLLKKRFGDDFPSDKYINRVLKLNDLSILNNEVELMPGVIELLEYLKKNNIICRVGTSTAKKTATTILKNLNIYDYFDLIISGEEVRHSKPAPDVYLKCLGDINKENAFVFEDSRTGAKAAINAGIDLILVPDVLVPNQDDIDSAYKVINNLNEAIPFINEIINK